MNLEKPKSQESPTGTPQLRVSELLETVANKTVNANDDLHKTAIKSSLDNLFTGLTDEELVTTVQSLEQAGRILDHARVLAATQIKHQQNKSSGDSHKFSEKFGHKNEIELLKTLTLNSRKTITSRLALADSLYSFEQHLPKVGLQDTDTIGTDTTGTATTSTDITGADRSNTDGTNDNSDKSHSGMGESFLKPKFSAIAKSLEVGLLPIETAEELVKDLTKVAEIADDELTKTVEKNLVSLAIGADIPSDEPRENETDADTGTDADTDAGTGTNTSTEVETDIVENVLKNGRSKLPETNDKLRNISKIMLESIKRETFKDQPSEKPAKVSARQLTERFFHIGKESQGLVSISGRVTKETAALMGRVMDALLSPRATTSKVRFEAQEAPTNFDVRTPAQKRHDAFMSILQIAANSKDTPQLGGAPVTVMIQVNEEDVKEQNEKSFGLLHGHDGNITPININTVNHAACSGSIQKVILDSNGKIVQLGTKERIFNSHQRKAILIRDGGCIIPGCETPATWCEIHHVKEHSKGGATHTDNGVTLCWYHHRSLDHSGWKIKMENGTPWVKPPKWLDPENRWHKHQPPHKKLQLKRA